MILVLGGGLAGLALGRRLAERGVPFLVLEAEREPGGLARSFRSGRFEWDAGPHALYGRDPAWARPLEGLGLDLLPHGRRVRIAHHGSGGLRELEYPFENGLHLLPARERLSCVLGYCLAAPRRARRDFPHLRAWIEEGLGAGIARSFMLPYNAKIWDAPLEDISTDLVRGKIEPGPWWSVLAGALFGGGTGRAYQASFLYPRGGIGRLTAALAAACGERLRRGFRVRRLRREGSEWIAESDDGARVRGDRVVSAMPVPELLAALGPLAPVRAEPFRSNDTRFVVIGLKAGRRWGRFADCHWAFFAGPEAFYRIHLPHNFDSARPAALVAEATLKAGTPGDAGLASLCLRDLRACGVLGAEEDVELCESLLLRGTYPLQTLGLARARAELEAALASMGVRLLGRSGRWDYLNCDGVLSEAERCAGESR